MIVKRALISVSDKEGIVDFAHGLQQLGIEIISTGGSAKLLAEQGIKVIEIAQFTGFPEMLDGRVKTLHPKVHAGLLAKRDLPQHMETLSAHHIATIDLLVVNLYPFVATINKPSVSLDEAIENIDIGGPAMLRSAAKNYQGVAVVSDHLDYPILLSKLAENANQLSSDYTFTLAKKAFAHTARYDSAIANWLSSLEDNPQQEIKTNQFPDALQIAYDKVLPLRYGENPHQKAAFYRCQQIIPNTIAAMQQIQGKELSFNNIVDSDAAWTAVQSISEATCVIVKHANPCGVASDNQSLLLAYKKAFKTDSTSAFGGIVAFNRQVDASIVSAMNDLKHFVEVLLAPDYTAEALALLASKSNLRVLRIPQAIDSPARDHLSSELELKYVAGGLLLQSRDDLLLSLDELKVVSKLPADRQQLEQLLFAWRVVKMVKSNAIVFCRDKMTLGIGAGQMSRVDSTRIAVSKAEQAGLDLHGSFVASDAFFPFRDGVDVLAKAGAKAIIQPGGSVRDAEVIAAADEYGLIMVFTGVRHFRH